MRQRMIGFHHHPFDAVGPVSPGVVLIGGPDGELIELAPEADRWHLTMLSGVPVWSAPDIVIPGTPGALLYFNALGALVERAPGVDDQVLTMVAGYPAWTDLPGTVTPDPVDASFVPTLTVLCDLTGDVDGVETTFYVSDFFYVDSTRVFLNGLLLRPIYDYDTTPDNDGIVLVTAPVDGDELLCEFVPQEG